MNDFSNFTWCDLTLVWILLWKVLNWTKLTALKLNAILFRNIETKRDAGPGCIEKIHFYFHKIKLKDQLTSSCQMKWIKINKLHSSLIIIKISNWQIDYKPMKCNILFELTVTLINTSRDAKKVAIFKLVLH